MGDEYKAWGWIVSISSCTPQSEEEGFIRSYFSFNILRTVKVVARSLKGKIEYLLIKLDALRMRRDPKEKLLGSKKIILLGASVGNQWHIHECFPFITNRAVYQFDKSDKLEKIIYWKGEERGKGKPDAIILKECAAYFPGDQRNYRKLYKGWVEECLHNGVIPILATTVTVSYKGAQLDGVLSFNDWIRKYAEGKGLEILDLEKALRISAVDRRLRPDLSTKDGLHLNRKAYRNVLNPLIVPTLLKAFGLKEKETE